MVVTLVEEVTEAFFTVTLVLGTDFEVSLEDDLVEDAVVRFVAMVCVVIAVLECRLVAEGVAIEQAGVVMVVAT